MNGIELSKLFTPVARRGEHALEQGDGRGTKCVGAGASHGRVERLRDEMVELPLRRVALLRGPQPVLLHGAQLRARGEHRIRCAHPRLDKPLADTHLLLEQAYRRLVHGQHAGGLVPCKPGKPDVGGQLTRGGVARESLRFLCTPRGGTRSPRARREQRLRDAKIVLRLQWQSQLDVGGKQLIAKQLVERRVRGIHELPDVDDVAARTRGDGARGERRKGQSARLAPAGHRLLHVQRLLTLRIRIAKADAYVLVRRV